MKTCTKCKLTQSLTEFSWRNKSKGKKHPRCKTCTRKNNKQHYENNKAKYAERARKSNPKYVKRNREYVNFIKRESECADCKQKYPPIVMDFDHVRDNKTKAISEMVRDAQSLTNLQNEIEKCEVVCSNCHRIRTLKRRLENKQLDNENDILLNKTILFNNSTRKENIINRIKERIVILNGILEEAEIKLI